MAPCEETGTVSKLLHRAFSKTIMKKETYNLHSSVALSRFAQCTRSSTTRVLFYTHRSCLVRYAIPLAGTTSIPRPQTGT